MKYLNDLRESSENNSGVSPVIAVILMIAITVALVALVTVVVFDIGSGVTENPDITIDSAVEGNGIELTVIRNENVEDITVNATNKRAIQNVRAGDTLELKDGQGVYNIKAKVEGSDEYQLVTRDSHYSRFVAFSNFV